MTASIAIGVAPDALTGQAANDAARAAFADIYYPAEFEFCSHLPAPLVLTEIGLVMDAAAAHRVTMPGFDRLQRCVTTLAQIARSRDYRKLVTIRVLHPRETAEPEPVEPVAAPGAAPAAPAVPGAVTVVQDDDEDFVVELDGVWFRPMRNQVRDDGTLTSGGRRAFESARAAAHQEAEQ